MADDGLVGEIAAYLAAQGIGTVGTDILKGYVPEDGSDCVCVLEYAGYPPEAPHVIRHPGLQVRVLNAGYGAGRKKMQDVEDALHGLSNTSLSGIYYLLIMARGCDFLGWKAGVAEFSENFEVSKR